MRRSYCMTYHWKRAGYAALAASLAILVCTPRPAAAQATAGDFAGDKLPPIEPIASPQDHTAIPLYPNKAADGPAEQWANFNGFRSVRNVVAPTLMPVLPAAGKGTGAAVIVAPGGAFLYEEVDREGLLVAHQLADRGVAAFVLKYRLRTTSRDAHEFVTDMFKMLATMVRAPNAPADMAQKPTRLETPAFAVEDAQAAVRLVRGRAAEWHVDPHRVGFIGFSAGAILALNVGLSADQSARPNFIAPIYGPQEAREVPAFAPAMFLALAMDDPLYADQSGIVESWRRAKRPVEAHYYEHGGHGFAGRKQGTTSDMWFDEFYAWMRDDGWLRQSK